MFLYQSIQKQFDHARDLGLFACNGCKSGSISDLVGQNFLHGFAFDKLLREMVRQKTQITTRKNQDRKRLFVLHFGSALEPKLLVQKSVG